MQRQHLTSTHQRGAVLIVSLVILTVLTIIAVNTSTDIGLQTNMARNSQLAQTAFNVANSELTSQLDTVQEDKTFIFDATDQGELTLDTADHIAPAQGHAKTVEIEYLRTKTVTGYSKPFAILEIHSTARQGTAIGSDQTMGIATPSPE